MYLTEFAVLSDDSASLHHEREREGGESAHSRLHTSSSLALARAPALSVILALSLACSLSLSLSLSLSFRVARLPSRSLPPPLSLSPLLPPSLMACHLTHERTGSMAGRLWARKSGANLIKALRDPGWR
jgi:hypothetical protein